MKMNSFTIRKIILQREEKIYNLKMILKKTISYDAEESIISQIKEEKKDLEYFENLNDKQIGMGRFLH